MEAGAALIANIVSQWIWPILQFVIGLSVVIFVHELGHFLVAKAVRIKVVRFALGFGPRLFGVVRGETDYCINALPLGGYVQMLGQEDVKPLEEDYADPRAFGNKSVGARFAVISAGVIMNVILAAILFVVVCLIGKTFPASVVGGAAPGWPAASAKITWDEAATDANATTRPAQSVGMQAGDRIVSINGEAISRFDILKTAAALAGRDEIFTFKIEREIDGATRTGTTRIGVKPLSGGMMLGFGILAPRNTVIDVDKTVRQETQFRTGDRVVAIAGQPVKHHQDIKRIAKTLDGSPVKVTVLRKQDGREDEVEITLVPALRSGERVFFHKFPKGAAVPKDGGAFRGDLIKIDDEKGAYEIILAGGDRETFSKENVTPASMDRMLDILGMVPRFRVGGIVKGTPADKAGLKTGDIVLSYGDRPTPTFAEFRRINKLFADKGTEIIVLRGAETKKFWIVPKNNHGQPQLGVLTSLDLAHPVVAAVRNSPTSEAGLPAQARLLAVTASDPNTDVSIERKIDSWGDLYRALKEMKGKEVSISYAVGVREAVAKIGVLDETMFDPRDYELHVFDATVAFRMLRVKVVKRNPAAAVAWGVRETWQWIRSTYASLRALLTGTASHKNMMGPVGIGGIAVSAGRQGLIELVYLMAFISVAVAVFNFLPIPVVDGGHAVFLLIEKIRGKPVSARVINIVQRVGLLLLLGLFIMVTWNDIVRLIGNL